MAPLGGGAGDGSELGARGAGDGGTGGVLVQVPGQKRIGALVDLGALDTGGDLCAAGAAGDLDVEGLGPELPVGDGAVVVDGGDLGAEDVVAVGDVLGDAHGLGVVVVVEDDIRGPLARLLLCAALGVAGAGRVADQATLVDLEEGELGLVDLGAVAVAGGEPGGGPAVVAAVPSDLVLGLAATGAEPLEGDLGASGGFGSEGRWRSILVGDDVRAVDGAAHHGLMSPAYYLALTLFNNSKSWMTNLGWCTRQVSPSCSQTWSRRRSLCRSCRRWLLR